MRKCCAPVRAIRDARRSRVVYNAINLRVSRLISSVTKSRSGHEFSRAHVQKYRVNFWFQFSGLWPYGSVSFSSGNGDISREEASVRREGEAIVRLLDGFRDSSHFHEDRPNSLFAHVSRASRPCIIAARLFIRSAVELSLLRFESRTL